MTPSELIDFLTFTIPNRFPTLVKGKPGAGKTDIMMEAATKSGYRVILTHPVTADPTDYKGFPFPNKDGKKADFLPYGDLYEILHAKEKTVFFVDDLGQASLGVQKAVMQLVHARRINGHLVSDLVTFIAATNRMEDMAGVIPILQPVKSRFSIQGLEADSRDWVKWALKNNMPTELIAYIRFRPGIIDDAVPTKELENTACPRTIALVGDMQNKGLPRKLEHHAFKGDAGELFATEYSGFLKILRELPSLDQILLHPNSAPVPTKPDVLYAISCALGKKTNEQNIDSVCTYLDRLPQEFSVACMADATSRDPELCNTRTFIQWSSDKAHLF